MMEAKQWTTADKSDWGPGPWQDEPDKMQWTDAATGLPCLIVRNRLGALCGYVGVPEGHPCFEMSADDPAAPYAVHGGLNFADFCNPKDTEAEGICHVTDDDGRVWWLGFDCSHGQDLSPKMRADIARYMPEPPSRFGLLEEVYRDVAYVQGECASLAAQLAAMGSGL